MKFSPIVGHIMVGFVLGLSLGVVSSMEEKTVNWPPLEALPPSITTSPNGYTWDSLYEAHTNHRLTNEIGIPAFTYLRMVDMGLDPYGIHDAEVVHSILSEYPVWLDMVSYDAL